MQTRKHFLQINDDPEEMKHIIMSIPKKSRAIEHFINPHECGWQTRYYDKCFGIDYNKIRMKQVCHNLLEALEWTFSYYTHDCKCWNWKYNYNYAPLLQDLLDYIPYFDTEYIEKGNQIPLEPSIQLAYVLPLESLNYLKHPNKALVENYLHSIISSYSLQWTFCKYLWEAHVHMPDISITKLKSILQSK